MNNFFDSLQPDDQFGFIGLGRNSDNLEIKLEPTSHNIEVKKRLLEQFCDKKSSIFMHDMPWHGSWKLENALQKALEWQSTIEDETLLINDRCYFSPHKWIVCLLGSDNYYLQSFISDHKKLLKHSANLSISMMALTRKPLKHSNAHDYQKLCKLTNEGMFVNIVKQNKADWLAQHFFGSMDVYPSD